MTEQRLIDATALKTRVCNIPAHGESEQFYAIVGEIARAIERAAGVDAVEVVRCRECKNSSRIANDTTGRARHCWNLRGKNKGDGFSRVDADGYCDEGERKEAHNGEVL